MTTIINNSQPRIWSSAKCRSMKKMAVGLQEAQQRGEEDIFWGSFEEALNEKEIDPDNFSLKEAFQTFVPDGRELVEAMDPRNGGTLVLSEINDPVKTTAFSNITGQIIYNRLMAMYNNPAFIGDQVTTRIPTKFDGEKIAGMENLDPAGIEKVLEAAEYPKTKFGEDYIETPSTDKYGMIVQVTKEAIFFDRTNMVLQNAGRVGHALGVSREKRILNLVLGATNSYSRKGTAVDTYNTVGDAEAWVNIVPANPLTGWEALDSGEQYFSAMVDPATSEPIMVDGKTLIVPRGLVATSRRIINTTEVRHGTDPVEISASPINGYTALSNAWVAAITTNQTTWFQGDFKRAFAYMENWPLTVVQAPTNATEEFHHDIVAQFKCSERGVPAVLEPMYVLKHLAA